jgi:hypothetical protein
MTLHRLYNPDGLFVEAGDKRPFDIIPSGVLKQRTVFDLLFAFPTLGLARDMGDDRLAAYMAPEYVCKIADAHKAEIEAGTAPPMPRMTYLVELLK